MSSAAGRVRWITRVSHDFDDWVFEICVFMLSANIPDSVMRVGLGKTFSGCSSLRSVTIWAVWLRYQRAPSKILHLL